jgi:FAD binding domain/Berberine and berberine like
VTVNQKMVRRDFCKAALVGGALSSLPAFCARSWGVEPSATQFVDTPAVTLSGSPTVIPAATIKDFASRLHGRLITAGDSEYEQARRIWNPLIDRRPALIVRCSGAADIQRAVAFARERELLLAVRGGGHSFPGYSMCNGGLVIDLSSLRNVRVEPESRTAQVAGGAWIGDLDWESQQYGLATPMGKISNTGVGGLTLGGGYGWLSRLHGLACDNLVSADLITADAKLLHVSAPENPDLFWAIQGGGGNFGVVSSFEYRLHPVAPQILVTELTYAPEQTRSVLEYFGEYAAKAPRELNLGAFVQSDETGARFATLNFTFIGPADAGEKSLQSLRASTTPKHERIRTLGYWQLQTEGDGPTLSPYTEYMENGYVSQITSALVDAIVAERGAIGLSYLGGAISDVSPTATAVAHRKEPFEMDVSSAWKPDPAKNERNRAEIHALWNRLRPFTSGFYANLTTPDQPSIENNFGPNRSRLQQIKKQYDPINLFRMNANIRPVSA